MSSVSSRQASIDKVSVSCSALVPSGDPSDVGGRSVDTERALSLVDGFGDVDGRSRDAGRALSLVDGLGPAPNVVLYILNSSHIEVVMTPYICFLFIYIIYNQYIIIAFIP